MTTNNEAFEKWYAKEWGILPSQILKAPNGYYLYKPTQGASIAWQAATTEANKRIAELEREVAIARSNENHADDQRIKCIRKYKTQITELQASNNDLREALEALYKYFKDDECNHNKKEFEITRTALSATPAQSLQAHDDEVIKRWLCKIYPKSEG